MARKPRDFKAEYQRRIEKALREGKTRKEGRGFHPNRKKGERGKKDKPEVPQAPPVAPPKPKGWTGQKRIETPYTRKKDGSHKGGEQISIPMTYDQYTIWQGLIDNDKPKTAKVFALAEVYAVPELAGVGWQGDPRGDPDYFEWYDDYEDWYDIPEYDDDYAADG